MALAKETRWKYEDASSRVDLPGRVEVLGAPVDPWTMEQTVEATDALIKEGRFAHLIGVNADKLLQMRDDPEMDACVRRCEIVNADGASMVMAAKKLGVDLPGRVAGIDLIGSCAGWPSARGTGSTCWAPRPRWSPRLPRYCPRGIPIWSSRATVTATSATTSSTP